jgi:hypothetical protein
MNETELLRAELAESKRQLQEFRQAVAQEHVNIALPVLDGLTLILQNAARGNAVLKSQVDAFLRALGQYQMAGVR